MLDASRLHEDDIGDTWDAHSSSSFSPTSSPVQSPARTTMLATIGGADAFESLTRRVLDRGSGEDEKGSDDDSDDSPPQDFADKSSMFLLRYPRERDNHWITLACNDDIIQLFHPQFRAGTRIQCKPVGSGSSATTRVRATIVGVFNGFLWRHEEGAAGVTSFAARKRHDFERVYQLTVDADRPRARFKNVSRVPLDGFSGLDDIYGDRGTSALWRLHQNHSATAADEEEAPEKQREASCVIIDKSNNDSVEPFMIQAKNQRTWFPTKTGNSLFDLSSDEDNDPRVHSYCVRQRGVDIKAVFGHRKEPFLFFAAIPCREAIRSENRPLFPMLCEYDVSASATQNFPYTLGQMLLLRKGARAGCIVSVIGAHYGRMIILEDGGFPLECDHVHHPIASQDPLVLEGFQMRHRSLQCMQPTEYVPCPKATCFNLEVFVSAACLFYRFGWFHLCRVLHHKGTRIGTTGVILGTLTEGGNELWEYNEVEGVCFPLTGRSKGELDANHGLEWIGVRTMLSDPPASPFHDAAYQRFFDDGGVSGGMDSYSNSVTLHPCRCDPASVLHVVPGGGGFDQGRSPGASRCVTPASSPRRSRMVSHFESPPFTHGDKGGRSLLGSPTSAASRHSVASAFANSTLLLDTKWTSLLPFGFGVHGSVVQSISGVRYGRPGIVMGCYGKHLFILFDASRGAEQMTETMMSSLRVLTGIPPRPVLFSPPVMPVHAFTALAVNATVISVDCHWLATWRFGVIHGQQLIIAPRSALSATGGYVNPIVAWASPDRASRGWRLGTVAGVYHGELFLWMHDTCRLEPLVGTSQQQLLQKYTFVVFDFCTLTPTEDAWVDDLASVATGARDVPTPITEIPGLQLFRVMMAPMDVGGTSAAADEGGAAVTPQTALVNCSKEACEACPVAAQDYVNKSMRKVIVEHGCRMRRKIRIEPKPLSRHRWRAFGDDDWCTVVGVSEGRLMVCHDRDPRFLRPLADDFSAEVIPPSSSEWSPSPALPVVPSTGRLCQKSHDDSLHGFHVLRALAADLADTTASSSSSAAGGRHHQGGVSSSSNSNRLTAASSPPPSKSQALRSFPQAMTNSALLSKQTTVESYFYEGHPQCDDGTIRRLAENFVDRDAREARFLCETLPPPDLPKILEWVLEGYGVRLRDNEGMHDMFLLLAAVKKNLLNGAQSQLDDDYEFLMPSVQQWCLHQREMLVEREVANRVYLGSQEKQDRDVLAFSQAERLARLKSVFDDEEEGDEDALGGFDILGGVTATDGLGDNTQVLSRSESFASTASKRQLSRRSTHNLQRVFGNKWRRSLDTAILNSVTSAAFLPATMRARIMSGTHNDSHGGSLIIKPSMSLTSQASATAKALACLAANREANLPADDDDDDDREGGETQHGSTDSPTARGRLLAMTTAAESASINRLEQLHSQTSALWPFSYITWNGNTIVFDISVQACEAYGMYHGQVYEVTRGDLSGERVIILGVYRRQLWRYSDQAEALPFDGTSGPMIVAQHRLVYIEVLARDAVRRADPLCYVSGKGSELVLNVSAEATRPFGVMFGERYAVCGKRQQAYFSAPKQAVDTTTTTTMSGVVGGGGRHQHVSTPSLPPVAIVLGVCNQQRLWLVPTHSRSGARPFQMVGGRTVVEEWNLMFLYSAPVESLTLDAMRSLSLALVDQHGDRGGGGGESAASPNLSLKGGGAKTNNTNNSNINSVLAPLITPQLRQRCQFRYRNKSGEILLFDTSVDVCMFLFGFKCGDRVLYRKPAKLCGKVCVILGVRDKRLWKVEERDHAATAFSNCKSATDIVHEYALKVVGHQALREIPG